jgi:hypothetical protein
MRNSLRGMCERREEPIIPARAYHKNAIHQDGPKLRSIGEGELQNRRVHGSSTFDASSSDY